MLHTRPTAKKEDARLLTLDRFPVGGLSLSTLCASFATMQAPTKIFFALNSISSDTFCYVLIHSDTSRDNPLSLVNAPIHPNEKAALSPAYSLPTRRTPHHHV